MSIYNIIAVAMVGIMTGVFNSLLAGNGYIAPIAANSASEAAATLAANYHHYWGKTYSLNVNLNARFQSKTYYTAPYEDAPGFGLWNLHTTHTFNLQSSIFNLIEPSIGIDNIFDRVDRRIDSSYRKYALYSPGRMFKVGMKVKF